MKHLNIAETIFSLKKAIGHFSNSEEVNSLLVLCCYALFNGHRVAV